MVWVGRYKIYSVQLIQQLIQGEQLMMKLISLFFITAGWIVSLIPMMLLTLFKLSDGSTGLALCFFAIILFITGQFIDLLIEEIKQW